jgi:hypothetical protein
MHLARSWPPSRSHDTARGRGVLVSGRAARRCADPCLGLWATGAGWGRDFSAAKVWTAASVGAVACAMRTGLGWTRAGAGAGWTCSTCEASCGTGSATCLGAIWKMSRCAMLTEAPSAPANTTPRSATLHPLPIRLPEGRGTMGSIAGELAKALPQEGIAPSPKMPSMSCETCLAAMPGPKTLSILAAESVSLSECKCIGFTQHKRPLRTLA